MSEAASHLEPFTAQAAPAVFEALDSDVIIMTIPFVAVAEFAAPGDRP